MLPAKRAELALAQAGETRDGVEHGILRVRELLLDVLLLARPSAATVHMPALARGPGEREDALRGERVGWLGVILTALLGATDWVAGECERVRATRVLEDVC